MLVLDVLVDNKEQEVFVFSCSQSDMITCSFVATCDLTSKAYLT